MRDAVKLSRAAASDRRRADRPESDVVTLVPLPPYSPELNPVERVWLYLRALPVAAHADDYDAIVDACCRAWTALTAEPGRIVSLCNYPWIAKVSS